MIETQSLTEYFGEPISVYTSEQATEDGFLFNLKRHPIFSHITTNLLLECGYMKRDERGETQLNMPNITDLLNQSLQIMRKGKQGDWFYSGVIELPSGMKQKVFIAQNESSKFTIMLPSDY